MSQERTEKATPRRRQKAREEGQVAKSRELSSAVTLFAGMLAFNGLMGMTFIGLKGLMRDSITFKYGYLIDEENIIPLLAHYFFYSIQVVAPFLGVIAIIGALASFMQVGAFFNTKVLKPKASHISPLKGLKRIFSMRTFVELIKSLLNMVVIAVTSYLVIRADWNILLELPHMHLEEAAIVVGGVIFKLGMTISILLLALGLADFLYQRYEYEKSIKMSKEEIKQEYKDMEGDPTIVGKRKERMRQLAMNRMIQAVPKADVIITNPTHIAVAVQYDIETMEAPIVLAIGEDQVAHRIREVAKEHDIEIVENKPLARALYETAEVGQIIPVDLYQAVAEVLAFVFRLQKRKI